MRLLSIATPHSLKLKSLLVMRNYQDRTGSLQNKVPTNDILPPPPPAAHGQVTVCWSQFTIITLAVFTIIAS